MHPFAFLAADHNAGITKNLVTKGAMDKIEIWSAEVLDDPEGENMMDNEEFVRKLDMYNL